MLRKREARHLLLTKRVNLEMYYIPVTDQSPPSNQVIDFVFSDASVYTSNYILTVFHCKSCLFQEGFPEDMLTLAGYLGGVDLWYDCNIAGLGAMILKLAQMVIITF